MAEFKNPKLVLGGAIIGGFTQEPEDHPIIISMFHIIL